MNRRGFVIGASIVGIFSPLIARAKSLMHLRGPTLWTGPTIKIALIPTKLTPAQAPFEDDWVTCKGWPADCHALEVYRNQRIVELPWHGGQAAFGGHITLDGVSGLVAGFGGTWPELPVAEPRLPSIYEPVDGVERAIGFDRVRQIAQRIVDEGGTKEGEVMRLMSTDGRLLTTVRYTEEMI